MEYKKITIKDLGMIVTGKTPSTKIKNFWNGNVPFITPKDIQSGKYIFKTERYITQEAMQVHKSIVLPADSICVSCIGNIGYVSKTTQNSSISNQQINSIICDNSNDSDFIYYLIKSLWGKFKAYEGQSTTLSILNKTQFSRIQITIPSEKTEQKKIANILSSLDDKIEINRKINENLEQQAQALFKSWFVDFEPFREGKFINSELGKIPEGWRVEELGDVTVEVKERVKNKTCVKVLSPITSGKLLLSEEYFTKRVYSESIEKYILVKPNQFAYNPARINIGSIGMNTYGFDGCVSPVYIVFECENNYQYFFDFFRRTSRFKEEVILRSIGGVRQTLNYKDFSLIKLVYPPIEIIENFNDIYLSMLNLKMKNEVEIKNLSSLRDALLPKLMNNEIKIK